MDPPGEAGGRRSWLFTDALYPPTPARRDRDGTSSETADGGKTALRYVGEYNRFGLQRGQWTDDASMALCLADSLCHCGRYEGADCRVRFYCWWTRGYNNAFRFSATKRDSVGLGGNIAASLGELEETYMGRAATEGVPPEVSSTGEDAGNGAMMRLAPIALRYAGNPTDAMRYAAASSRATHPGADSEACCAFMAYFMATAIARPQYDSTPLSAFLDRCIAAFPSAFRAALPELAASAGGQKVQRLLRCDPPSACEELWRWREPRLLIEESITARGRRYNGHPVLPDYFGAYSMDGLAMALWGMHGADSFAKAIGRVINLLGDADSTGAIAGQMAGAFYGASTMHDDPVAAAMIQHVRRWDPFMEIELRALMLVEPSGLLATPVPASQE
jgi:ADP-ribosyl-[dinitrogen reductase] hydrolase